MPWPNKGQREELEIRGFVRSYQAIYKNVDLEILGKGEKPDYVVKDKKSGQEFGVELTSVYLNDRSVPDEHIPPISEALTTVGIPHNASEVEEYKNRLIEAIKAKIDKAKNGYDLNRKLLLSIHVNEYRAIFIDTKEEWQNLVKDNEPVFDAMFPFVEIIFWNLANGGVFCVKPRERKPGSEKNCF